METIFDTDGHLTAEAISAFYACTLSTEELAAFSGHLVQCPSCAQQTAEYSPSLRLAPEGLTEQITDYALLKTDREKMAKPHKETAKKQTHALFFYSMRVAVAAGIAITILCSGLMRVTPQPEQFQMSNISLKLSQTLSEISNKLLQTEDDQDVKTEK